MSYSKRMSLLMGMDSIIVLFSIYIGYYILNPYFSFYNLQLLVISSLTLLFSHHVFAFIYRLYHKAWEYASVGELVTIVKAITYSIVTAAGVQLIVNGHIYVRVLFITWLLHMCLIGGSRFSWRIVRARIIKSDVKKKKALIVGAGSAGTMLVRQLLKNNDSELKPVAFVDDDFSKQKLQIYGVTVLGKSEDIPKIVENNEIDHIIIAIPSLSKHEIQRIFQECSKTNAQTKIMPMIEDIVTGKVAVNQFRDVQVEDLLGRDPVELDIQSISKKLTGKTILVTGAGGSIGSEICRQVSKFKPKKLLLLGHGENSIYSIDMELRNQVKDEVEIIPIIADVQDRNRIFEVMEYHRPDVVYHAAAHKHVPLMEYNPKEAVKNNVIGTKNVAEAADTFGVGTFVLVSSDKAVNPTNVMGSTKRIAEMVIQELNKHSDTKFVAVRFGNVLGSRGSVIPLFKKQIHAGGPVTVTHPEMTRYFMTIPEASRLVMQAGALARGGEIFVLDMGEPVKIVDLAENLIKLSGYTVDEIGIKFAGIRPGEKMFEELLGENEVHSEAVFPKIFVGKTVGFEYERVKTLIENYESFDVEYIREYVLGLANKNEDLLVKSAN
ncbi:polysaccharide biosynthesis protein [Metabacillus sediminilitoris]|uniref:Polysaccharide biosynthesis protein n=1 Tax=Metabacillus sediminilitoris TaxID=2567941 RepID=A0A4S4C2L2_9BACI|nr:nucleoside-diphosphate sugar epimerase/dehydratase [Metabacillus sediminilitoris]QGQ48278.1 NAD-dependent epimerase/dehydratase family protein [Metabacillus sediminilitoris]THF81364.1 polysaccharide biosynthesis protein [Metabacillus sediminilitoris]